MFSRVMLPFVLLGICVGLTLTSGYVLHSGQSIQVSPVWISEVDLVPINNETDFFLDIYYGFQFEGDERITSETLYLSLDNNSFVSTVHRDVNPDLMSANGTSGFFFSNAAGDPLPFDVEKGQTLFGYVEVTTTESSYRTEIFAEEIPVTVIRPFLFRIPSAVILVGGIALSVLPITVILYLCIRQRENRQV
ncbi:MAG: hypothetical protein JSW61_13635 [Candidatus Thorarchaeota archaeon]|nr:MAG: hypothetical protein JSW61_13635 [Candidatus Thorarchaeota archaeon]